MKRWRIVGLVLVIATVGTLWWASRQTIAYTFTLPDGNHLYFRAVTLGTNVQMNLGSPVDKLLGHLPGNAGRKYRRNVWVDENTEETLVFWFEIERAPSTNLLVEVNFKEPKDFTNFWPTGWLPAQTLPNGRILASCCFHRWPQQEKSLAVRIGTSEDKPGALRIATTNGEEFLDLPGEFVELGELRVRNPGYKREAPRNGSLP